MNIKINNTTNAINDAEIIIGCANSFESLVSTLSTVRSNFESNWIGEENADRTSIIMSLNNSISFYQNKIIPALKGLGNGVNAYAIATEQLAMASVDNPTLSGMNPSEYNDLNRPQGDPLVNDQTAYTAGENAMSSLTQKLGDNQDRWDTLDDMYLYFRDKGLTDEQIAGVLGNAAQESGFIIDIKNSGSSAKGLFQWIDSTITTNEGIVEPNQPPAWDLQTQLDHTWHQINTKDLSGRGDEIINRFNINTTVDSATRDFATFFEGYSGELDLRLNYANAIYTYIKNNFY